MDEDATGCVGCVTGVDDGALLMCASGAASGIEKGSVESRKGSLQLGADTEAWEGLIGGGGASDPRRSIKSGAGTRAVEEGTGAGAVGGRW